MKKNCLTLAIFFVAVALTYLLDVTTHATKPDPSRPVPAPEQLPRAQPRIAQPRIAQPQWRRTRRGWEKTGNWPQLRRLQTGRVHPLTVAALELLLSLGALVAFAWPYPRSLRRRQNFFRSPARTGRALATIKLEGKFAQPVQRGGSDAIDLANDAGLFG